MILTQAKIKGPPDKDGPFNKLNLFPVIRLFSYQHVVCFDLLDPSCLQESEEERYYDEGYGDDDYT